MFGVINRTCIDRTKHIIRMYKRCKALYREVAFN
jgi:hypothetical protein